MHSAVLNKITILWEAEGLRLDQPGVIQCLRAEAEAGGKLRPVRLFVSDFFHYAALTASNQSRLTVGTQ